MLDIYRMVGEALEILKQKDFVLEGIAPEHDGVRFRLRTTKRKPGHCKFHSGSYHVAFSRVLLAGEKASSRPTKQIKRIAIFLRAVSWRSANEIRAELIRCPR